MIQETCLAVICVLCLIVLLVKKAITRESGKIFFVVALILCTLGYKGTFEQLEVIDKYDMAGENGASLILSGDIHKIESKQYSNYIYIKVNQYSILFIDKDDLASEHNLRCGDFIRLKGCINMFDVARNEGNFDSAAYYHSIGIVGEIEKGSIIEHRENNNKLQHCLETLRNRLRKNLDAICGEEKAALFNGILLGERGSIEQDVREMYTNSGIGHILAISALHISMIGMFIFNRLRKYRGYLFSGTATMLVTICFGIMTGSSPSAIRAVIMMGINIIGKQCGRRYDGISAISVTIIVMSIGNHLILQNSGFILSIAAMLGIHIVNPVLSRFLKCNTKLGKAIVFSGSVNISTLPVIAAIYFEIPTYGILFNMLVIPLMSVVVGSGIVGMMAAFVFAFAGKIIIFPGCIVLGFYNLICTINDKLPLNIICTGKLPISKIVVYYSVLGIVILAMHNINIRRKDNAIDFWWVRYSRNIATTVMMLAIVVFVCTATKHELKIAFLDVGQGDGIVIENNNMVITIDGGSSTVGNVGKYRIIPYLKSQGIKQIDYAVLTHSDKDHISGIIEMLNDNKCHVKIRNLLLADINDKSEYDEILQSAKAASVNVIYTNKKDSIETKNMQLQVIYPEVRQNETGNNASIVTELSYGNLRGIFTGDLEKEGEKQILEDNLEGGFTFLKVGHHGSKNSSTKEFLAFVNPEFSIISAGENNRYGHPHKETIKRLKNVNSQIYNTADCGQITLKAIGEKVILDRQIL